MSQLTLPVSERDHFQGPENATVTLVEYGDYQCPHCGRAYPIVKAIQARMGDRLRFVFRNFPLSQAHAHAQHAAEAAEIAGQHGKFWEMHDLLFERQQHLEDDHLREYAHELGVPREAFTDALTGHTLAERVREDFSSGVRSGVNGTPTFFINGQRFDDSWDEATLLQALEAHAEK